MTAVPAQRWIELPPGVRDWIILEQTSVWIPPSPSQGDIANLFHIRVAWDALAGRLLRESLFSDDADPRQMRQLAEAVAAAAEQLAVQLGERL